MVCMKYLDEMGSVLLELSCTWLGGKNWRICIDVLYVVCITTGVTNDVGSNIP